MEDMPLLAGIEVPDENLRENTAGSFAERIYHESWTIPSAAATISGTAVFHAESAMGRTVMEYDLADRDYVDSVTQNISERVDGTDEKIRGIIDQIGYLMLMVDNLKREVNELREVTE